jgi:hypothetical protein
MLPAHPDLETLLVPRDVEHDFATSAPSCNIIERRSECSEPPGGASAARPGWMCVRVGPRLGPRFGWPSAAECEKDHRSRRSSIAADNGPVAPNPRHPSGADQRSPCPLIIWRDELGVHPDAQRQGPERGRCHHSYCRCEAARSRCARGSMVRSPATRVRLDFSWGWYWAAVGSAPRRNHVRHLSTCGSSVRVRRLGSMPAAR